MRKHLSAALSVVALAVFCPAGCADKGRCVSDPPAVRVEVVLGSGVDGAKISRLMVDVELDGKPQKTHPVDVTKQLADGSSSFELDLSAAAHEAARVAITVSARGSGGATLATGTALVTVAADACEVVTLTLKKTGLQRDGGVDGPRDSGPDKPGLKDTGPGNPDGTTPGTCPGFRYPTGWCWHNPTPHAEALYGIWGTGASDIWAVGSSGTVMHFDGKAWKLETLPTLVRDQRFYGVWGSGKTNVYVVGSQNHVLQHNGLGWTDSRLFVKEADNTIFNAVWGSSASNVVIVGQTPSSEGVVGRFNGLGWNLESNPTSSGAFGLLEDVWGSGPSDIWAAGQESTSSGGTTGLLVRYDKATTGWKKVASGPSGATSWLGVWASSHSDIWTVGHNGSSRLNLGNGVVGHNDGGGWKSGNTGGPGLEAIWGDSSAVFAAGSSGTVRTRVGAASWTALNPPPGWTGAPHWTDIWGASSSEVYLAGRGGEVFRLDGSGKFTPLTSHNNDNLNAIWGTGPTDLVAVGRRGAVWRYDGKTWSKTTPLGISTDLYGVWGNGPNDIYTVGTQGAVFHFDGGAWKEQTSGTTQTLRGVWGSGKGDVWAVGHGGTVIHHDGTSWSAVTLAAAGDNWHLLRAWTAGKNGPVVAVGMNWTTGKALLLHNTTAKHSAGAWTEQKPVTCADVTALIDVWGSGPSEIWSCGSGKGQQARVARFDGKAWTCSYPNGGFNFNAIRADSKGNLYAVGSNGYVAEVKTNSWAGTWTPIPLSNAPSPHLTLTGVWAGAGDLFVVGHHGAIVHRKP